MYNCDATGLLNIGIYLVFVGKGWLELVPSHLPHLRHLVLTYCSNVCHEYVKKHVAALPELRVEIYA
jgi:hypothetical protein